MIKKNIQKRLVRKKLLMNRPIGSLRFGMVSSWPPTTGRKEFIEKFRLGYDTG